MSRRRPVETPEYAQMVGRMIAAHGRRVADADPEDLADLVALRQVLEDAIAAAVAGMRQGGTEGHYRRMSWSQIARGLGTTRQAAQMRYGQPVDSRVRHLA